MHEFTRVGLELTDGRNFSIKGRRPKVDHRKYPSISLRFPGTKTEPEFIWQGDKLNETTYNFQLHVKNTTPTSLPVEKMIVYSTFVPLLSEQAALSPVPRMMQSVEGERSHLLIGFTTVNEQSGHIQIKKSGVNELIAFTLVKSEMKPGEAMSSERVLVSFERDPHKAVALYTKTIAKEMPYPMLTSSR